MSEVFYQADVPMTPTLRVIYNHAQERKRLFFGRPKINYFRPAPPAEATPAPHKPKITGYARVPIIQGYVAAYFGMSRDDLLEKTRRSNVARRRQIAVLLASEFTTRTLPELGHDFGGYDEATMGHAVRKTVERAAADPVLAAEIAKLRAGLAEVLR